MNGRQSRRGGPVRRSGRRRASRNSGASCRGPSPGRYPVRPTPARSARCPRRPRSRCSGCRPSGCRWPAAGGRPRRRTSTRLASAVRR
ncbi:hypothetical protein BRC74_02125 [Halobacteriales archaeon QH_7_68_42]|nr:MAG: hypothetical protein BRC74_02125 [Halobacteriales archaeon QH_7_68_42]